MRTRHTARAARIGSSLRSPSRFLDSSNHRRRSPPARRLLAHVVWRRDRPDGLWRAVGRHLPGSMLDPGRPAAPCSRCAFATYPGSVRQSLQLGLLRRHEHRGQLRAVNTAQIVLVDWRFGQSADSSRNSAGTPNSLPCRSIRVATGLPPCPLTTAARHRHDVGTRRDITECDATARRHRLCPYGRAWAAPAAASSRRWPEPALAPWCCP